MPNYIVNRNTDNKGYHEVHDITPGACTRLPDTHNRVDLGYHVSCSTAVSTANSKGYRPADGCYYCCEPCHRG